VAKAHTQENRFPDEEGEATPYADGGKVVAARSKTHQSVCAIQGDLIGVMTQARNHPKTSRSTSHAAPALRIGRAH
jgi:hypothetical protein